MDSLEKPKPEEPPKPEQPVEVKPEMVKPVSKIKAPTFFVQEVPTQVEKVIVDGTDEKEPVVYDLHAAVAMALNKLEKIEKALA